MIWKPVHSTYHRLDHDEFTRRRAPQPREQVGDSAARGADRPGARVRGQVPDRSWIRRPGTLGARGCAGAAGDVRRTCLAAESRVARAAGGGVVRPGPTGTVVRVV